MRKNLKYRRLYRRLEDLGILPYEYFAELMGVCLNTIKASMAGHRDWRSNEMYKALDIIHEPDNKLHLYFPKNGIEEIKEPSAVTDGKCEKEIA